LAQAATTGAWQPWQAMRAVPAGRMRLVVMQGLADPPCLVVRVALGESTWLAVPSAQGVQVACPALVVAPTSTTREMIPVRILCQTQLAVPALRQLRGLMREPEMIALASRKPRICHAARLA
jgi:hypothetical protein